MSLALFWFRQDLRCQDNPALTLACKNHESLIPIYIKETHPELPMGSAQKWWLHHSLTALGEELQTHGLELYLREANPLALFEELLDQYPIEAVYWNRCYEPMHRARDQKIKERLKSLGLKVISCNGSLLHEPWEILNQSQEYFKVFTPYWRACLKSMHQTSRPSISTWPKKHPIASDTLDSWTLLPKKPNWAVEFGNHWQPGSQGAEIKLKEFLSHTLKGYKEGRNYPAESATSKLSPHLHFGEISVHSIWSAVQDEMRDPLCDLASAQTFLSELGWREFSYQLLFHRPEMPYDNLKKEFDAFPWQANESVVKAWQQGLTGYPIVDAGMRELWRTGYMHNRVRMIVASFLIKDLLIHWRTGAEWFWDTLLDADLANNSASWQWVAGSGADAAPYYRIFNPVLQGEKFDPNGDYIRLWVPELAAVHAKWIHKPWLAPKDCLPVTLGKDYPLPMVDHALAREEALAYYKNIK